MAVTIRENDIRAAKLMLLSWVLSVISQALHPPKLDSPVLLTQITFYGALVFPLLVFVAIIAGIWAGYRWVKIIYVVLLVAAVINYVRHSTVFLSAPIDQVALALLTMALRIWAMMIIAKDLLTRQPEPLVAQESPDAGVAGGGYNRPN